MANLAAWLLSLGAPLAKRVLIALGIGVISYTGYSALVDQVKVAVLAQWGQLGGATLALMSLGGVGEALGIILSAFAARAALMAAERLGRITQ
jgi:hypothetical protein